jgi:hypothetical protein
VLFERDLQRNAPARIQSTHAPQMPRVRAASHEVRKRELIGGAALP